MILVFTDLDGTLLDHHTYDWRPAKPALDQLSSLGAVVVFVSSKTRIEMEYWRRITGNTGPFISENGAALCYPDGSIQPLGLPHAEIRPRLLEAAARAACRIRGFSDMSADEIGALTGLGPEHAALAKQREFSEPFVLESEAREAALIEEMAKAGLRHTVGGRFHHAFAHEGKGAAVRAMIRQFESQHAEIVTIGLGDAPNDASFLELVHCPIVVRSAKSESLLKKVPRAIATNSAAPGGWNEGIKMALRSIGKRSLQAGPTHPGR